MHAALVFAALLDLQGYVAGRGLNATQPAPRLEVAEEFTGVAQVGLDWSAKHFGVHVSGAADERVAGLIEAYAELKTAFGNEELQLRAGQFFLPTSRENKDELWTSPYTINFSALNSWIAQEVRPIGADLQWRHTLQRGDILTAGATAFQGNDTMGALLGWRGWTIGSRLSRYDELLPLPPLSPFFADQRDDGTKPFGRDLDARTGIAARLRYSVPQRANVQYAYVDNRGDRRLHRGEYAWETDFHLLSGEIGNPDTFTLAAEYMTGSTGMGVVPAFVQADFYATYVLLSAKRSRNRWTARYELFGTQERDFSLAERNDESGRAWTLAWLFDVTASLRAGVEFTQVAGHRGSESMTGRATTLEARYRW
jgi:hypothetical protein